MLSNRNIAFRSIHDYIVKSPISGLKIPVKICFEIAEGWLLFYLGWFVLFLVRRDINIHTTGIVVVVGVVGRRKKL